MNDDAALLDDVAELLARYVRFPSPAHRDAVALWTAHAHAVEAFDTTPRLALLSAEKASGKTRTLEVLQLLTPAPLLSLNISAAAMFRLVETDRPTLLFDEVDAIFGPKAKEHEDVRALLNAGYRRGATVPRCVGEGAKMKVKSFRVFAPAALAAIGELPDTVMSRSVVVRMKRRAAHEHIEPFRHRRVAPSGHHLRDELARWAATAIPGLRELDPVMPEGVNDRTADTWEPLIAVADVAGGDWPQRARAAAVTLLEGEAGDDGSRGVRLLADIRSVFETVATDRLASADLAAQLATIEEAPWGDIYGRPLDARGLARRLRPFGIRPDSVRFEDGTLKGYQRAWFEDAWSRYLLPLPGFCRNTGTEPPRGTKTPRQGNDVPDVPDVPVYRDGGGMFRTQGPADVLNELRRRAVAVAVVRGEDGGQELSIVGDLDVPLTQRVARVRAQLVELLLNRDGAA
jgi:hypothetical protein